MSAFKQLRDVSNNFEQQLRTVSTELFSAKIGESFEDGISKKLNDLTFLNSKLRLLRAKPIAGTPQVTGQPKSEETIQEYGEVATWKVLEQCIVKSLTQSQAVKGLITTPDRSLDPELVEGKEKIIHTFKEYSNQEANLRQLDNLYREKQDELAAVRAQWDQQLTELRELREATADDDDVENMGPSYIKLRTVVDKLELMRWLIGRLVTSRVKRDWLADPKRTAAVLKLARATNTVEMFTDT